jgi:hypothetical protein
MSRYVDNIGSINIYNGVDIRNLAWNKAVTNNISWWTKNRSHRSRQGKSPPIHILVLHVYNGVFEPDKFPNSTHILLNTVGKDDLVQWEFFRKGCISCISP